jgi:hypothetical protein
MLTARQAAARAMEICAVGNRTYGNGGRATNGSQSCGGASAAGMRVNRAAEAERVTVNCASPVASLNVSRAPVSAGKA